MISQDDLKKDLQELPLEEVLEKYDLTLNDLFKHQLRFNSVYNSRKKIRYINRTRSGKYAVQKHMDGENIYYGTYNSKEEAEKVAERLLECNWDKEQLETILREEGIERSIRE